MFKSRAIVGRPTVTNPASSVLIIVTQTTVTSTIADVPFDGFTICLADIVFAAESLIGTDFGAASPSFVWMLAGFCNG